MPSDASIYGQIQQPQAPNRLAELAQAMQVQGLMGQHELSQYTLKSAQRKDDETSKLAALLKTPGFDLATPDGQRQAYGVAPTVADSYIKNQVDRQKATADIGKITAETGHLGAQTEGERFKTSEEKRKAAVMDVIGFKSPQEALAHLDEQVATGKLNPEVGAKMRTTVPTDPTQFRDWQISMAQRILTPQQMVAQMSPDANARLQAQTSTSNNAATNANSTANNKRTIEAENLRAGVLPGGGMDENSERTAQAIASGQLPAPTGMALLNPKNQRILGRVMEINPQYDATTVDAKKKAARDFTSGSQGNAMRSFAVAGQHLDQLGTLVDAMDNGNMQLVNKIGNAYSQQTGNPAVTNFEAAKDVVSKEVVKAIVAGGGGVSEREELSKLMANAKSPAQLKGVIQQYRNLMGAQHEALLQQRDAAGLPRSTLPNYNEAKGASSAAPQAPAGWTYLGTAK